MSHPDKKELSMGSSPTIPVVPESIAWQPCICWKRTHRIDSDCKRACEEFMARAALLDQSDKKE